MTYIIYLTYVTCGDFFLDCPGHFGHTLLVEPVFHVGCLSHLKNMLQCVCISCLYLDI